MSENEPTTLLVDGEAAAAEDRRPDEASAPTLTAPPGSRPPVRTATGIEVPPHLGHFEVKEVLGEGGMGAVFRAFDTSLHRDVAVKVLRSEVADHPDLIARFQREARSQAQLTHPNITTIYFVGAQDGFPFFAIELVPGGTLADPLREAGYIEWKQALEYMIETATGLRHAHSRGIIHRDIKPANLLLDADGRVKIADFGLARPLEDADAELTGAGAFMGTPQYVAPEQARGAKVDHRADIYSLGATFFHLLAGRPPFEAPTPVGIVMMHGSEPVPDLREFKPEVPPALRDIINRMMAKSPDDRFASYDELLDALVAARPRGAQPAGLFVRGVATLVDIVPWVILSRWMGGWFFLGFVAYFVVCDSVFGRTLGKALVRLKVEDLHGDRLSPLRSLARTSIAAWILFAFAALAGINEAVFGKPVLQISSADHTTPVAWILAGLAVFSVVFWLVGLGMSAVDPRKRMLHDRLTDTRVVYAT